MRQTRTSVETTHSSTLTPRDDDRQAPLTCHGVPWRYRNAPWQRAYRLVHQFARYMERWETEPAYRRRYASKGWTRFCKARIVPPFDPDVFEPNPVLPERWIRLREMTALWRTVTRETPSEIRENVKARIVAGLRSIDYGSAVTYTEARHFNQ